MRDPAMPAVRSAPAATVGDNTVARGPMRLRRRIVLAVLAIANLLGAISSIDALVSTRTAPGAVAWIASLNTFPYFAVPAYRVFGRTKFQGYVIGRRDVEQRMHGALKQKMALLDRHAAPAQPELQVMERLAKLPLLGGNRAELLLDGDETFASMFAGFDAAFVQRMAAKYEHDFGASRTIGPRGAGARPWWFRLALRAAYLLAPVL
jgi:hypothetical protein